MLTSLASKLIAGAVGILVVIAAVMFFTGTLSSMFTAKKQARLNEENAEAGVASGVEASNTLSNVVATDARTDQTVKGAIDEVRAQPPGNSNAAAVRATCRLRINVNSEYCARMRQIGAADAVGAGPRR